MSLCVDQVHKAYGDRPVLKNVSFEMEDEEFVCILGHSGCGKSTLLNLIAGFIRPDQGQITVNGEEVTGPSRERGVVFQDHALFPWYSVLENIAFGPEVQGLPKKEVEDRALHYLKLVGLEQAKDQSPAELSGGMKQRVGIARALAAEPELLLMDEPFGALDVLTRESMRRELTRIWMSLRTKVLFITHDIKEAIQLGDRVIVMKNGSIAADAAINLERPRSYQEPEFTRLLTELETVLIEDKDVPA
jgi:NitT/TauT family transport system ATP-binding protein